MKLTQQEQIEKINGLEQDDKGLILIKAIENIFKVDEVVETVIGQYNSNENKKIGYTILDNFRDINNYMFFTNELKNICGFNKSNEIVTDIIFEHFSEKEKDIQNLKDRLIKEARAKSH